MHEGIFIAASAAYKQERVLAVATNNLANVNNTGFKRDGLVFKEILSPFEDRKMLSSRSVMSSYHGHPYQEFPKSNQVLE